MSHPLEDFAKRNSKFIKLKDGESFEGLYLGYRIGISQFDPEKETVTYSFQLQDGKSSFFQTASNKVANLFKLIPTRSFVKITRRGVGTSTIYLIESDALKKHLDPQREYLPEIDAETGEAIP